MMSSQTDFSRRRIWSDFFLDNYLSNLLRKNLFFKILLLACTINVISMGVALLVAVTSSSGPIARVENQEKEKIKIHLSQGIYLYATPLIEKWVSMEKSASISYADHMEKSIDFKPFVFNSEGQSLIKKRVPLWIKKRAKLFISENNSVTFASTEHGIIVIRRLIGPNGNVYLGIACMQSPDPFPIFPPGFRLQITITFIMLVLLSVLLARHITSPITKLSLATREIATGNLEARIGDTLGRRQDEIAKLGLAFDQMATQIQGLIKERQRLFRDISHDLRSPLTRLSISLEISRKKAPEEIMPSLHRIDLEAERLNALIGEILMLSKLEANPNLSFSEMIDLSDLIRRIGEDANFEAKSKNVSVIIAPSPVIYIYAYPEMLYRAIENVVRNAIRHTAEGTIVNISIEFGDLEEEHVIMIIQDCGPGVPSDALPHLFEPFYRVEGDRGLKTGGIGVGLAIAYRSIKLHKGEIKAENAPGTGLKVTITIPKTVTDT